jgi:hypothetical protein
MKWLGATIALLTASVVLVGWIFLRDRHITNWRPSQSAVARADARAVLASLEGYDCRRGCSYRLLGSAGSHRLVRVTVPWATRCFEIDTNTFEYTPKRGLSGIEPVRCSG